MEQHVERRLPGDADWVQLRIAPVKWQILLCLHQPSIAIRQHAWPADITPPYRRCSKEDTPAQPEPDRESWLPHGHASW